MMLKRLILLLVIFGCFSGLASLAQNVKPFTQDDKEEKKAVKPQDDSVVKVKTELVTVLVSVTDQKGNLVNNLAKDDFELLENTIPQEIFTVARENTAPLRLIVLFDTSVSVKPKIKFQQQAATKFFKSVLRPVDRAALLSFNHDVRIEQDFTSDVEALLKASRSLKAKGGTALYDAIYLAAQQLEKVSGRRVIVVISDGSNVISKTTLETALRLTERADAVIYGIYTATKLDEEGATLGDKELEKICERTGGEVFFPKDINDLDDSFARLAAVVRAQYVLTFYPANEQNNEQTTVNYRALKVNVKNPDLKVRARKGYYASKD
ncbi:MAG: VWA domain-containing protein [Blastocatellia bacterium]|nr:VWA domain-containing protein [Blastocatellia bacterium]MBL8194298.1 VWA domain-containing protein [Blastocatellia bacterium]MBN8724121.1 VWA domain-containing protein [Acidobacteriota bacterium]